MCKKLNKNEFNKFYCYFKIFNKLYVISNELKNEIEIDKIVELFEDISVAILRLIPYKKYENNFKNVNSNLKEPLKNIKQNIQSEYNKLSGKDNKDNKKLLSNYISIIDKTLNQLKNSNKQVICKLIDVDNTGIIKLSKDYPFIKNKIQEIIDINDVFLYTLIDLRNRYIHEPHNLQCKIIENNFSNESIMIIFKDLNNNKSIVVETKNIYSIIEEYQSLFKEILTEFKNLNKQKEYIEIYNFLQKGEV